VETPSFTFRLERVRTLRERAEERAREALSTELRNHAASEMAFDDARDAVQVACELGRSAFGRNGMVSAHNLQAVQGYLERTERLRSEAALELSRATAEVAAKRKHLAEAGRERQAIDKLKERQKAAHDAEWARRSQNTLDELALAVHRRGIAA
jgi:flagellar FliJ protein